LTLARSAGKGCSLAGAAGSGAAADPDRFLLFNNRVIAIVPPSLPSTDDTGEPLDVIPVLNVWVRGVLVGLAVGLGAVFAIALWLDPYDADGVPLQMETHRQLGLPPCTFYAVTGFPCPSCGMTTSFALLMHGDPWNSLKANAVGTLMALVCLLFIPWSLVCVFQKRTFFIRSIEKTVTVLILVFLGLMMLRWGIVVWMTYQERVRTGI
jgi:Protein of unknown function (DUF2752)